MGFGDLVNQGKGLYEQNKEQVDGFVKSEQAEDISDEVLDAASDAAKKVAPEGHHDTVDDVRANLDKSVGEE
ncbi:hypothetical protein [Microbacterium sp. NPDC076911]|uniref:hypothetical protein n=1 Tax=Microbacterium sp. NPDC076911 TaxID=3154958 RepID=UPI0034380D13